jgi:hypothetical protein
MKMLDVVAVVVVGTPPVAMGAVVLAAMDVGSDGGATVRCDTSVLIDDWTSAGAEELIAAVA